MDILKTVATDLHARLPRSWDAEPFVVRLTADAAEPQRSTHALLLEASGGAIQEGFASYFFRRSNGEQTSQKDSIFELPQELGYLQPGDILRVNPRRGELWVMYRKNSPSNSILLTERCNSWCIMCSQPPKPKEDPSFVQAWFDAIPLMDPATKEIGITGGEPTLLSEELLQVVRLIKVHLPQTGLHILSNGRMFNYLSLASAFAVIAPTDTMIGIPLYSDIAWQHDFVVQSPNAFDQTIRGIMNLARCRVPIEIRVVTHRYSVPRLRQLAEFITRNLPFVQHVALMGLEPIGFGQANFDALWIDPVDYQDEIAEAVATLVAHEIPVSIYNHQLCVLPETLWPFARQSISDWKNIYLSECSTCQLQSSCGGFFHSATTRHSRGINPVEIPAVAPSI
jgi:His-Xaa-Ser system radical SAM maturase HxsC